MKNEKYKVINIRDYYLKGGEIGEKMLKDVLSDFTCPMNKNASTLVGYFTLASKSITVKEKSNEKEKKK